METRDTAKSVKYLERNIQISLQLCFLNMKLYFFCIHYNNLFGDFLFFSVFFFFSFQKNNNAFWAGGSYGKESTRTAGDAGLIHGWGRSPGGENGNSLKYSCLGNPMDREA